MRTEKFNSLHRIDAAGCWIWQGKLDASGYGKVYWRGKQTYAHRVAAELAGIDTTDVVMHTCNRHCCVNPAHLRAGTQRENIQQSVDEGRTRNANMMKTHCKRGHEFTPENIYYNPSKPTERICRACTRLNPRQRGRWGKDA